MTIRDFSSDVLLEIPLNSSDVEHDMVSPSRNKVGFVEALFPISEYIAELPRRGKDLQPSVVWGSPSSRNRSLITRCLHSFPATCLDGSDGTDSSFCDV